MVIGIDSMGSICSSSKNNNNNATLPPKDLGELLEQAEKVDRGSGKVGMGELLLGYGLNPSLDDIKGQPRLQIDQFWEDVDLISSVAVLLVEIFFAFPDIPNMMTITENTLPVMECFCDWVIDLICSGGRFLSLAVRVWDVPGQVGSGEPCQGDQAEPTSASRKSRLPTQTSTAARISKPGSTCWRREKHRLASPTPTLRCWGSYCS